MRDLVLWVSVSLDGFMEGPDRQIEWHAVDEEVHAFFNEHLETSGAFLEGRVTHEMMADFWPTADEDPANPAPVREFARIWRDTPKYVYSRTLASAEWGTTIVREVVPEEVEALKARPGGVLLLGGGEVATAFLAHDLVDEFWVFVHPFVIGRGRPFSDAAYHPRPLTLLETRSFTNGVVLLRYRRSR